MSRSDDGALLGPCELIPRGFCPHNVGGTDHPLSNDAQRFRLRFLPHLIDCEH